jgi:hypothetical protein
MRNKKNHSVRAIQKTITKIAERNKISTPYIHDRPLSWLGTAAPIKCCGVLKLVLWVQI